MSYSQHLAPLWRSLVSLDGLSTGDAFGESFFSFSQEKYYHYFEDRILPEAESGMWRFTDDTQMALSLMENLRLYQSIEQDQLTRSLVEHYEPGRAYGAEMHTLLRALRQDPISWSRLVRAQNNGQGLAGNGAATRVAPLGAFFADDLQQVVKQARLSAMVTHSHPEAIAGAIAVAVASALAYKYRVRGLRPECGEWIEQILPFVPGSEVHKGLQSARDLSTQLSAIDAAALLGSGDRTDASDSIPYVIWCAGRFLDNYEEALWQTVSGLGDVDSTCAMVGGIVVSYTGVEKIPADWVENREQLPRWVLTTEN